MDDSPIIEALKAELERGRKHYEAHLWKRNAMWVMRLTLDLVLVYVLFHFIVKFW